VCYYSIRLTGRAKFWILIAIEGGIEMIRFWIILMMLLTGFTCSALAQNTPYGSCPERAQVYQERYERTIQSRDLVCYQKALEREMSGKQKFSCPYSAQYYQNAYEKYQRSNDFICYQQALQRELQ